MEQCEGSLGRPVTGNTYTDTESQEVEEVEAEKAMIKKPVRLPRKMSQKFLDELYRELNRGEVYECRLRDTKSGKHENCYGLSLGQKVYIDQRLSTLDTLIHELCHRMEPTWSEGQVVLATKRLIYRLSEQDKAKWWRAYGRIKVISRNPIEVTDEGDE